MWTFMTHGRSRAGRLLGQLTTRRTDLTELLDTQPKPPSPEAVDQLRRDLAHVLDHGTPGQEAKIGTHVAEIQIQGIQLIPIYRDPPPTKTGQPEPRLTPPFRAIPMLWAAGDSKPEPKDSGRVLCRADEHTTQSRALVTGRVSAP